MLVADILKNKEKGTAVVSLGVDAPVRAAVSEMVSQRIGAVLVRDAARSGKAGIAGILSERDVVCGLAANGADLLDRPISDLMTADVVTCSPEDSIAEVMEMMTEGRFRHLPVVSGGRLAGIISIGDVVKARLRETAHEMEFMAAYVQGGIS
jgi:CBS domain-containing protein